MKCFIICLLFLQASGSFIDEFRDVITSIEETYDRTIASVKESIDCSILAVQQVLALGFRDRTEYEQKCGAGGLSHGEIDDQKPSLSEYNVFSQPGSKNNLGNEKQTTKKVDSSSSETETSNKNSQQLGQNTIDRFNASISDIHSKLQNITNGYNFDHKKDTKSRSSLAKLRQQFSRSIVTSHQILKNASKSNSSENVKQNLIQGISPHSSLLNVHRRICNLTNETDPQTKLENARNVLKYETQRLVRVNDLLRRKLDNITNEVKNKFKEYETSDPSLESVWYDMKVLYDVEQTNGNSTESKEISRIFDKLLDILDIRHNFTSDMDKIETIIEKLESEANITLAARIDDELLEERLKIQEHEHQLASGNVSNANELVESDRKTPMSLKDAVLQQFDSQPRDANNFQYSYEDVSKTHLNSNEVVTIDNLSKRFGNEGKDGKKEDSTSTLPLNEFKFENLLFEPLDDNESQEQGSSLFNNPDVFLLNF